jgi:hypothetical protein
MIHKEYLKIINKLGEIGGVEIITNGDMKNLLNWKENKQ